MARMKFLCDADRCIECNACVTACKNENEVPWGINRRRVVTINDGKPGERSVSMACMHCTDAPCQAVCPTKAIYTTEDGVVCCTPRTCASAAAIASTPARSGRRNIRSSAISAPAARWTVHLLRRRPGGGRLEGRVRKIRRQPSRRRQAAAVRGNVLDQVAAGRRRRKWSPTSTRNGSQRAATGPAPGAGSTAYRETIES